MSRKLNGKLADTVHTFMMDLPDNMTDIQLASTICVLLDSFVDTHEQRERILNSALQAMSDADDEFLQNEKIEKLAGIAGAINDANRFLTKVADKSDK